MLKSSATYSNLAQAFIVLCFVFFVTDSFGARTVVSQRLSSSSSSDCSSISDPADYCWCMAGTTGDTYEDCYGTTSYGYSSSSSSSSSACGGEASCSGDSDCDDGDYTTVDSCFEECCKHWDIECLGHEDCDDGDPNTTDRCETHSPPEEDECNVSFGYPPVLGSSCINSYGDCVFDSDCDDGDDSTVDWCFEYVDSAPAPGGPDTLTICRHGECYNNADCDDGDDSTTDRCDTSTHTCLDSITCTISVVNSIVQQCCGEEYSPYYNCTSFSNDFHTQCENEGLDCSSVATRCDGQGGGHALNVVNIGGDWCFVEPQGSGIIEPCGSSIDDIPDEALCDAALGELNSDGSCDCEVINVCENPIPTNDNPTSCATDNEHLGSVVGYAKCTICCDGRANNYEENGVPASRWRGDCLDACENYF